MKTPASQRLFVAINFPREVKTILLGCVDKLKRLSLRGNFTPEDNFHLTLAFIGESAQAQAAIEALNTLDAEPFVLVFGRIGKFSHDRGDLYWQGINASPELASLQSAVAERLSHAGFRLEDRTFRPHITLGREIIADKPDVKAPAIRMRVTHIELMESVKVNGKISYRQLHSVNLTSKIAEGDK